MKKLVMVFVMVIMMANVAFGFEKDGIEYCATGYTYEAAHRDLNDWEQVHEELYVNAAGDDIRAIGVCSDIETGEFIGTVDYETDDFVVRYYVCH